MFGFLSTPLWLTELSLSYNDRLFPLDRPFGKRNSFLVTTERVFAQCPIKLSRNTSSMQRVAAGRVVWCGMRIGWCVIVFKRYYSESNLTEK